MIVFNIQLFQYMALKACVRSSLPWASSVSCWDAEIKLTMLRASSDKNHDRWASLFDWIEKAFLYRIGLKYELWRQPSRNDQVNNSSVWSSYILVCMGRNTRTMEKYRNNNLGNYSYPGYSILKRNECNARHYRRNYHKGAQRKIRVLKTVGRNSWKDATETD